MEGAGDAGSRSRDHVSSLERGLVVLEVLAENPSGLTLTEVSDRTGLTRAGARRFLLTLVATGHARQDGRRFTMTARLLALARGWLDASSPWQQAEPFMRDVAAGLNESCSAAVLSGDDVVYVARVAGERIISVALNVGTRLPAYCTSMGRVLLSGMGEPARAAFLKRARIRANTSKTVTDRAELAAIIRRAGEAGYALVDEELEIGLRSIAVPVRDNAGRIVAAINVSTQSARHSCVEMEEVMLPLLRRAATGIGAYFSMQ